MCASVVFPQTRRAEQQHVIERLFALARRLDENRKLAADFFLADVLGQLLGPQRALERLFLRRGGIGGDQAVGFNGHALFYRPQALDSSFKACLMPSDTESPSGNCFSAYCASFSL